jgi:hypothetical protein
MFRQFIRNIKYLFLRTEHIRLIKEENTALTRALIESIDLVADYKRAIQEMQRMIAMIHTNTVEQMAQDFAEFEMLEGLDDNNNEEEEARKEYNRALMKKITIH